MSDPFLYSSGTQAVLRVYTSNTARRSHLLQHGRTIAVCGRRPWPGIWRGFDGDSERAHAEALPLCALCYRKAER